MFDDDNSGTISLEEMMMLISKIGGNLTEGEAVGLIRQIKYCVRENKNWDLCFFRQADTDNNGVIDKEEFRQLWGAVRCSGGGEVGDAKDGYFDRKLRTFQDSTKRLYSAVTGIGAGFMLSKYIMIIQSTKTETFRTNLRLRHFLLKYLTIWRLFVFSTMIIFICYADL